MKRLLTLLAWAAAGISVLGLTTAGPVTAGVTYGAVAQHAQAHVIDLHAAWEARLGHTTQSPLTGIYYAEGDVPLPGRGGNTCTEPNCPLPYNGGAVQHTPHVYLLLWGPDWQSDPGQETAANYLESFYQGLGVSPPDDWSTILTQYKDGAGPPVFNGSVYEGAWNDTSTPPAGVGQSGLAAEADTFATNQGITDLADAQIIVATQSGTCPAGFPGSGCGASAGTYCAWHSYSNEPYTNLPYMPDAGSACGEDSANPDGTYDGFSIAGGHEYADTITDPVPESAWWDPDQAGNNPGWEVADKCSWGPGSKDVALSTGSFAMQGLWSDAANGCVLPVGSQSDIVTVADPGNQTTFQASKLNLPVTGISSGSNQLTWSAAGLPPGLTIGSSNGVISGQIKAVPGITYTVLVTASDSTGALGWVTFSWKVKVNVGKTVKNRDAGVCINDHDFSIAPHNGVVMWTCNSAANERWSHPTNTGELVVLGQCLTDPGKGGAGALQIIEPCTGAPSQEWYHNSQGEYVVEETMLCLTDLNGSQVNGDPVMVEKCTDATDQRWTGS